MTVFYNKTLPISQLLLVHSLLQFVRTVLIMVSLVGICRLREAVHFLMIIKCSQIIYIGFNPFLIVYMFVYCLV